MRISAILAAAIMVVLFVAGASQTAVAHGWKSSDSARHVHTCPKRYRHRHKYRTNSYEDPYRYCYVPRGSYPYYNSGYWRPRHQVKTHYRFKQPPYYKAWGENRRHYRHREWHRNNHGRIPFWRW